MLQWHGAAHYHIFYNNLRIVIDPLYTRPKGDMPHLDDKKEDVEQIDYLLLTHGHLDHSKDVPWLILKHKPASYVPEKYLLNLKKNGVVSDNDKYHSLDKIKGKPFSISNIEVTPYQIGTEEIDFWFIRSMSIRPWRFGKLNTIPDGIQWLTHHLFGNCFAFYFKFPTDKTMLYFGNLTDKAAELDHIKQVNVLALPYCPANQKWQQQSQYLINRFNPDVTLIHHYDNFMNPYTKAKYLNLDIYSNAVLEKCSNATLFFSKFREKIDFSDILDAK